MRTVLATALMIASLAAPAMAAPPDGVLTPAPVPGVGPAAERPADRAGRPDGAERAAPFSGLPSSVGPGPGVGTPSAIGSAGRDTAPTPSVSR